MKKLLFIGAILFPSFAYASFDTNLSYGATGQAVIELQEFLTSEGVYTGPITGNFYTLSLKGVQEFQKKYSISPVSGFFGPITRQKANLILSASLSESNNAQTQETGSIASSSELQRLKKLAEEQQEQARFRWLQDQNNQLIQLTQTIVQNTSPVQATPVAIDTTPVEVTPQTLGIGAYATWNQNGALWVSTQGNQKNDVVSLTVNNSTTTTTKKVEQLTGRHNMFIPGFDIDTSDPEVRKYEITLKVQRNNKYTFVNVVTLKP